MVESPLVLAFESRDDVREVVVFYLDVREVQGIVGSGKFAEAGDGGAVLIFCGGLRVVVMQLIALLLGVLADGAGEGVKLLFGLVNLLLKAGQRRLEVVELLLVLLPLLILESLQQLLGYLQV